MFGTIRKHQTWLWVVIITLTVIAFVVYFSPYQRVSGGGGGSGNLGSIAGKPVTLDAYRKAEMEVYLNYFLTRSDWPDKDPAARQMGFDTMREAYFRMFLIEKQKQFGIQVSSQSVGRLASDIIRSFARLGIQTPEQFEKGILAQRGMKLGDFERFLRHELGTQQLVALIGLTGKLITPEEAEALYRREFEEMQTEAVFFSGSNFLSQVTVTPEDLQQFYSLQQANYRIPERVQVSYVKFEITNFLAEADAELTKVTNLTALIDAEYQRRGTNFQSTYESPEAAKAAIQEEERQRLALRAARQQAALFTDALLSIEPARAENLEKLAKEKQLEVRVTGPFDETEGPPELKVPPAFAREAFKLTETVPISERLILSEGDGVYVLAYNKRIPSEIPPLENIRDDVTADYRFIQAVQLARSAGTNFVPTLTNGIAQGRSLSNIVAGAGLPLVELPPFALSTQSLPAAEEQGVSLGLLQEVAFRTPPGETSDFVPTRQGGFVLHVAARLPVTDEQVRRDLPAFLGFLRQTRQSEAFNDWFRRQASEALRDTPVMRQAGPGGVPGG